MRNALRLRRAEGGGGYTTCGDVFRGEEGF